MWNSITILWKSSYKIKELSLEFQKTSEIKYFILCISEENFIKIRGMWMTEWSIIPHLLPRLFILYLEFCLFIHIPICLSILTIIVQLTFKPNFDFIIYDSFLTESVLSSQITSTINLMCLLSIFLVISLDLD